MLKINEFLQQETEKYGKQLKFLNKSDINVIICEKH